VRRSGWTIGGAEKLRPRVTHCKRMQRVHLVRVMTDAGERQIWLAATGRDKAVDRVLDAVPLGWSASLIQRELDAESAAALNLKPGEVRQHQVS